MFYEEMKLVANLHLFYLSGLNNLQNTMLFYLCASA